MGGELSGRQIEQLVDELILLVNIIAADPARLALPDHVHRFVALNRSPGCLEFAKALLGLHSSKRPSHPRVSEESSPGTRWRPASRVVAPM